MKDQLKFEQIEEKKEEAYSKVEMMQRALGSLESKMKEFEIKQI